MAEAKRVERPLSPHLQIYRWQIPMLTSILTRITGHALYAGFFLAVWWLLAAAISPEYFDFVNWLATSWIGILIWVGSAWAMWFHYLTGLRHLYYDAGKGLDVPTAEKLGWACLIGSVVLTALTVLLVAM
ncbi:succinate dehydrogenase, cytochrome b556 subunit [Neotabrizicola shimadae]|uniref:Succinate dehydrogenase cytochrome b556 subunit n=1 Tax=Neotabrizicola shimadae TaxID=2807096 RepID=A0A8G0ZT20_9RHOB|nr:succinate dehydrogenase, cytochrome b556 subunit [Neotabrizicola shimadae]QYZ69934.1 succinate dehydrogenase, cytochrome b556 subunit [Neotabrizicola shimadae]